MKIYWTKEASLNIQEIEDFISQDNAIAAIKLVDKLITLTDELIDFPDDFPDLEHFETFMKSVFNKKYGSVLFSSVTDSFNDNCNEWPQIIGKTLNKKS